MNIELTDETVIKIRELYAAMYSADVEYKDQCALAMTACIQVVSAVVAQDIKNKSVTA